MLCCVLLYLVGDDYSGNHIMVNIPPGLIMQSFTISIIDNNIVECNEAFNVTVMSVTTCGVTIGNIMNSEVMIRDDDGKHEL